MWGGAHIPHNIPHNKGSWIKSLGGTSHVTSYQRIIQPDRRVYFAGDHTSELVGWQECAALSAWRCVQQIGMAAQEGRFMQRKYWLGALLLACVGAAHGQVKRIPLPHSNFPISEGVWVGKTLYMSGMADHDAGKEGATTTEQQTMHTLAAIQKALEEQTRTMGDVVMMHVYLAPDPATGGKCDFVGFMKAYTQFCGTAAQPNKPARSAMQVGALVVPNGLVEIEVIASK